LFGVFQDYQWDLMIGVVLLFAMYQFSIDYRYEQFDLLELIDDDEWKVLEDEYSRYALLIWLQHELDEKYFLFRVMFSKDN
jgi:hypothetical protein